MKAFQAAVLLSIVVFHANADLLNGLPIVGDLLGGGSSGGSGLPIVGPILGGLPVVGGLLGPGGIVGNLLNTITGLLDQLLDHLLGQAPIALMGSCGANAQQCSLLNFNTTCEKPCGSTQVCLYVCTGLLNTVQGLAPIPLLNNCVCQDGFYRNSAGLCVALDVCLPATGGISG